MTNSDRFNRKTLSVFLSYYKPHWKLFAGDMFCAFIVAAIDTAFPMLSRYTLNKLIPDMMPRPLFIMIACMVLMYVVHAVANWFIGYWGHIFGARVEADMRRDLFNHIEEESFSFFDTHRTGHLMSRVTTDLFEVTELAHHGPEDLLLSVLILAGSFIMLFNIRWELALVVIIYIPICILIVMQSRRAMNMTSRKVKERTADINATLESSISGVRVTQAFTNEQYEINRFNANNGEYVTARGFFYKAMCMFHTKLEFGLHLLDVIVLALGGWFIMQGTMTIADLVAAQLFVAAFQGPIRRLSNFVEQFTTGMAGFNRFLELMRTHSEIPELPDAPDLAPVQGNICYRDVTFAYNENAPVLSHVNLEIKAGQTVALAGPSGAGKTTICHLLPRFYQLTDGTITIDGTDIANVSLASLRRQIGIVQQDVFLFAGTIRENIAYGCPDATFEQVVEAAKRAEIHDDIMKMKDGYDTIVGERGVKLSGGQKQRVSIARTFLKNPPILILDEATSALDTATELKIQHSFDELSKGRTTLVIAHRLSTIKNADRIAVVTEKGIEEAGTHDELMAKGGLYSELYTAQYAAR